MYITCVIIIKIIFLKERRKFYLFTITQVSHYIFLLADSQGYIFHPSWYRYLQLIHVYILPPGKSGSGKGLVLSCDPLPEPVLTNDSCHHMALHHSDYMFVFSHCSVGEKLPWFIRLLSDGLFIFHTNLSNLPSDIWVQQSEMSNMSDVFRLRCHWIRQAAVKFLLRKFTCNCVGFRPRPMCPQYLSEDYIV